MCLHYQIQDLKHLCAVNYVLMHIFEIYFVCIPRRTCCHCYCGCIFMLKYFGYLSYLRVKQQHIVFLIFPNLYCENWAHPMYANTFKRSKLKKKLRDMKSTLHRVGGARPFMRTHLVNSSFDGGGGDSIHLFFNL